MDNLTCIFQFSFDASLENNLEKKNQEKEI